MNKLPRTYSVKVPTKPYLRKFTYARYGSPLPLNYNYTLGVLILGLLENPDFSTGMNRRDKESRLSFLSEELELVSPLTTMRYKGYQLSDDKIIVINRFLEDLFYEELHRYCRDHINKGARRAGFEQAITAFCALYDIEIDTDITMDALKKSEWRARKRQEKEAQKRLQRFVHQGDRPTGMQSYSGFGLYSMAM